VTRARIDLVRTLASGFSEVDFAVLRDGLAEAGRMEDLVDSVGEFGELMLETIDRDVHVHLHDINAAFMVGKDFHGWDGFLEFWRSWLEPWESYSVQFSGWEEIGDTVLYRLDIAAEGRGSGVNVLSAITQAWTIREGKVIRLGMYASRRRALADLGRD
jgi:hypothetical protein